MYMRNHNKSCKHDPPENSATLVDINPHYAYVRLPSGVETTVNVRDIGSKSTDGEDTCTNPSNPEDTHELYTYNHENAMGENEKTMITSSMETDTSSGIDGKNEAPPTHTHQAGANVF